MIIVKQISDSTEELRANIPITEIATEKNNKIYKNLFTTPEK